MSVVMRSTIGSRSDVKSSTRTGVMTPRMTAYSAIVCPASRRIACRAVTLTPPANVSGGRTAQSEFGHIVVKTGLSGIPPTSHSVLRICEGPVVSLAASGGRSSAGRALASQAKGRGFEPRRPLRPQPQYPCGLAVTGKSPSVSIRRQLNARTSRPRVQTRPDRCLRVAGQVPGERLDYGSV